MMNKRNERAELLKCIERNDAYILDAERGISLWKANRKIAEDRIAELDAKEDGKPKLGDEYWTVDPGGDTLESTWQNDGYDLCRWDIGNVYLTRRDAEDAVRRQKIRVRLQRLADASGGTSECDWYQICLLDGVPALYGWVRQYWIGAPRFATRESAESAIEEIGEDDLRFLLEGE